MKEMLEYLVTQEACLSAFKIGPDYIHCSSKGKMGCV